jgi:Integron cassette protein VCH_CASS1 chain
MPQQVTDVDVLRDYLRGVMDRADHHAQNVNEVALAVAGGVIWRKDDDPLEVMVREGEMKNVLWFKVNGQRYVLSYNHGAAEIELRRGTTRGNEIASFSNAMPTSQVRAVFRGL